MFLTVLGKYGPYPVISGNTSGYLLEYENTHIAFEMGSGVFSSLSDIISPEKISCVILSHYHYDHISDIGIFNYFLESLSRRGDFSGKIKLYAPDVDCLERQTIERMNYFDFTAVKNGDAVMCGNIKLNFFSVKHTVPCLGFTATGDKKFLYSGDTDFCNELTENIKSADFALLDGAFIGAQYKSGGSHMSAEQCLNISSEYGVKAVVTHQMPTNCDNEINKIIKNNKNCVLAEEGRRYSI